MEQKQEEGFERHVHARSRPFSTYRSSLQLIEPLRICLLAVAHRYPTHSLDINEAVLGPQEMGAEGWRTTDLIELLQEVAPRLLPALARLEVTLQRRGIYLLDSWRSLRSGCTVARRGRECQSTEAIWLRDGQN
jgi:hypothetical protein